MVMDFKEIQRKVFEEYKKNGYLERWGRARELLKPEGLEGIVDLAEVGLFVTEIAEAMEDIRSGKSSHEVEEHADTIIRIMNYCSRSNLDLEQAILSKHERNLKRAKLHGRKI